MQFLSPTQAVAALGAVAPALLPGSIARTHGVPVADGGREGA
jgi:hypothetical protein